MSLKGILRPSTRQFLKEARQVMGNSLFNILHGYVYGRWTYFYIAMGSGRHPLARRLAPLLNWIGNRIVASAAGHGDAPVVRMEDTYHGKVVPLAAAKQLVSVKEDIPWETLNILFPTHWRGILFYSIPTISRCWTAPAGSPRRIPACRWMCA